MVDCFSEKCIKTMKRRISRSAALTEAEPLLEEKYKTSNKPIIKANGIQLLFFIQPKKAAKWRLTPARYKSSPAPEQVQTSEEKETMKWNEMRSESKTHLMSEKLAPTSKQARLAAQPSKLCSPDIIFSATQETIAVKCRLLLKPRKNRGCLSECRSESRHSLFIAGSLMWWTDTLFGQNAWNEANFSVDIINNHHWFLMNKRGRKAGQPLGRCTTCSSERNSKGLLGRNTPSWGWKSMRGRFSLHTARSLNEISMNNVTSKGFEINSVWGKINWGSYSTRPLRSEETGSKVIKGQPDIKASNQESNCFLPVILGDGGGARTKNRNWRRLQSIWQVREYVELQPLCREILPTFDIHQNNNWIFSTKSFYKPLLYTRMHCLSIKI